jgi:hypothetical protein
MATRTGSTLCPKKQNTAKEESEDDGKETIHIEIEEDKPKKRKIIKTGPVWSSKLIEFIWLHMQTAWKARSDALHDRDRTLAKQRRRDEIITKVKAIYELKPLLSAADRPIIDSKNLYNRLNQKTHIIEHWYDTNVKVIHYCAQQQQERLAKGNRDIRNFFKRVEDIDDDDPSDNESANVPLEDISITNESINHNEEAETPTQPIVSTVRTGKSKYRDDTIQQREPQTITAKTTPRCQADSDSDSDSDNTSDEDSESEENFTIYHTGGEPPKNDTSNSLQSISQSTSTSNDTSIPTSESSYQPSTSSCETQINLPSINTRHASRNPSSAASSTWKSSTNMNTSRTTRRNSSSNQHSPSTLAPCTHRTKQ